MAIKRDYQHAASGFQAAGAYWRINSVQIMDAPQDDANRGVAMQLVAYVSRIKSRQADSATVPGSDSQVMILRTPGSRTQSGNDEVAMLLEDGSKVPVDPTEFDHRAFNKAQGYALLRKYHPGFKGAAATDVIEKGQTKLTL